MGVTPRHEVVDVRVWNQDATEWQSLAPWKHLRLEHRADLSVDTLTFTVSDKHPVVPRLRDHRRVPVLVTLEVNGIRWSGLVTNLAQRSDGEVTAQVASDDKHAHRILARSRAASAVDTDATQVSGAVGQLLSDFMADGAQRTGLPLWVLREHEGDQVRLQVRSEQTVSEAVGDALAASDTYVTTRMLLPGMPLPGSAPLYRTQGPAEYAWEQERLAAGAWPDAATNSRLQRRVLPPVIAPVPPLSWLGSGTVGPDGHKLPNTGEGVAWLPFMLGEDDRGYWQDGNPEGVRVTKRDELWGARKPGWHEHVTRWAATTFGKNGDTRLLDATAKAGLLVKPDGTALTAAQARSYIGAGAAYAWSDGTRWFLANQADYDREDKRRNPQGPQRQTPGVLLHVYGGRDRRAEVLFSSARGGGLEGWETVTTAPEAAMLHASAQLDEATLQAIKAGLLQADSQVGQLPPAQAGKVIGSGNNVPDTVETLDVSAQPFATVAGTDVAYSHLGGRVNINAAGPFFYREMNLSIGGSSNPVGEMGREWAKAQGSTAVNLTTGYATNAVFGDDVQVNGRTVFGWRPGDRVSFTDGNTRMSEVVSGYTLESNWDAPLRVAPLLGRQDNGVMDQVMRRVKRAEDAAERALLQSPRRVPPKEVDTRIETNPKVEEAWREATDAEGTLATLRDGALEASQRSVEASEQSLEYSQRSQQSSEQSSVYSQQSQDHSRESLEYSRQAGQYNEEAQARAQEAAQHSEQSAVHSQQSLEHSEESQKYSKQAGEHSAQAAEHSDTASGHSDTARQHSEESFTASEQANTASKKAKGYSDESKQYSATAQEEAGKAATASEEAQQASERSSGYSKQSRIYSESAARASAQSGAFSGQSVAYSIIAGEHSERAGEHSAKAGEHSAEAAKYSAQAGEHSESASSSSEQARIYSERSKGHVDTAKAEADKAQKASSASIDASSKAKDYSGKANDYSTAAKTASDAAVNAEVLTQEALKKSEKARGDAEEARRLAEVARDAAENKRADAEKHRANAFAAMSAANASWAQAEEARAQAEEARKVAEEARADAEHARSKAEDERSKAEKERDLAEKARSAAEGERTKAETARSNAEGERKKAENARSAAETARNEAETKRSEAEKARSNSFAAMSAANASWAQAEEARAQAEEHRRIAEEARKDAEKGRAAAEDERKKAERARKDAETARDNAETSRSKAEGERSKAEGERNAAEQQRKLSFNAMAASQASMAAAEASRAQAEEARADAERKRDEAEKMRSKAEGERSRAENARKEAEIARSDTFALQQFYTGGQLEVHQNLIWWTREQRTRLYTERGPHNTTFDGILKTWDYDSQRGLSFKALGNWWGRISFQVEFKSGGGDSAVDLYTVNVGPGYRSDTFKRGAVQMYFNSVNIQVEIWKPNKPVYYLPVDQDTGKVLVSDEYDNPAQRPFTAQSDGSVVAHFAGAATNGELVPGTQARLRPVKQKVPGTGKLPGSKTIYAWPPYLKITDFMDY